MEPRQTRGRRLRLVLVAVYALLAVVGGALVLTATGEPSGRAPAEPVDIPLSPTAHEMVVADLVRARGASGVVLVLQERGRGRYLLLTIGESEALAIVTQLTGAQPPPRPLTHDLMARTLDELGARVIRVIVTELRDNTYYARLVLQAHGRVFDLDARPSDAVALALRAQAPIYAEGDVLERAALTTEEIF